MQGHSRLATGNVNPCRFQKLATTAGYSTQCTAATDNIFGISGKSKREIPLGALDDGYHAIAGETVRIHGEGEMNVLLEIGGTVAAGDMLTSDSAGKGITTVTDHNQVGAKALQSGVSGDLIIVQVLTGRQVSL